MVVGGSRQETLDMSFVLLGTRQQGVPVILRELMLPGRFDLVSPGFTVRDTSISKGKHGIQWTDQNQLDDLNFADDLALLSHTHEQVQIKTASVAAVFASVGLNVHKGKTKVLKFKTENSNPITLDGETLDDVESFTYLGSIVDEQRGSDADVKGRIGKDRVIFLQLNNIWNSKQLSTHIKVRIFMSRQFYCTELKLGELQQPPSRRHEYL
ncbi:unnamed protein product [Schistosoma margrebowiei]|uniref:DUF6451 domain-containing protein n=1 Tax=Schistosoma margrebowiei TaxID=48269 RepID=A0A183MYG1_9TREM|nr:unnamed protein product [Schistosoma margrebowiei]